MSAVEMFLPKTLLLCAGLLTNASGPLYSQISTLSAQSTFSNADFPQLTSIVDAPERVWVDLDIKGQVVWMDAEQSHLFVQTDQGCVRVRAYNNPSLRLGQYVRIKGQAMAGMGVIDQALISNDGIHSEIEKSATIRLKRGAYPIRVEWFNGGGDRLFRIEYAGPTFARLKIPDSALSRIEDDGDSGTTAMRAGLSYQCYEGDFNKLPVWGTLVPTKTGVVSNFDLIVRTRDEDVALVFEGFLNVSEDGLYTFWEASDDGSRVFLGDSPLSIEDLGIKALPEPQKVQPGSESLERLDCYWATLEGVVTGSHFDPGGALELELCSDSNYTHVIITARDFKPPGMFSRLQATGVYCKTPGVVTGRLLIADANQIRVQRTNEAFVKPLITTSSQLHNAPQTGGLLCLTGTVVSTVSQRGLFALQDDSGGVVIRTSSAVGPVSRGDRIVLSGNAIQDRGKLIMAHNALVDNDGVHPAREKVGAAYLSAGKHPIHVSWFNRRDSASLEVRYQKPGSLREKIPDTALLHAKVDASTGEIQWHPGLIYSCYHGTWSRVPITSELTPVMTGIVKNFDLKILERSEDVALEFSGFLDVPRDGVYSFTLVSDDGSLLFIDEQAPERKKISPGVPYEPFNIFPNHGVDIDQDRRWSKTEGTVEFASEDGDGLLLELNSPYGLLNVRVLDATDASPILLQGARIKVEGICQSAIVPDAQRVAAAMIVPGIEQISLLAVDPGQWRRYPLTPIKSILGKSRSSSEECIVRIQGDVESRSAGRQMVLRDGSGAIVVETIEDLTAVESEKLEVIGRAVRQGAEVVIRCGVYRVLEEDTVGESAQLPLLTTVRQIKHLTRDEAVCGYPVDIRGVITLVRNHGTGVIIQDATSAIDVWWPPYSTASIPVVGDYWEIAGETSVMFSPVVLSRNAKRLGTGILPQPQHPTLAELLNGSQDTRYVEIQGIVTHAKDNVLTLFTGPGKIEIQLSPAPPRPLKNYVNALIRIRGCVVPMRDEQSQQVQFGQIRLSNMSISTDEPAPADVFDVGSKRVSDLLLFDAQANALQRVRIQGQVLCEHNNQLILRDGTNAIRVFARDLIRIEAGDKIEAVGFPELSEGLPVLQEALVKKTGKSPLPMPVPVSDGALFTNNYDGMLVSVRARLIGVTSNTWEKTLELQIGDREFLARLQNGHGILANPELGSLVEVVGVYSGRGARHSMGESLIAFDFFLNSASAVTVLERPPWWTLRRAVILIGGMSLLVMVGMIWILLLRRQVERRSSELGEEIHLREQIQRQNELEKERSRIASDMHDQLGANITRVGLLAELTKKNIHDVNKIHSTANRIASTAFRLGQELDEIIWVVNPKNDALDKFCDYLAFQAQELFQLTSILCRVDLPPELPNYPLSAEMRHNLFFAAKEALRNVVRHSGALEVWVRFRLEDSCFSIAIADNGRGFVAEQLPLNRNGLDNMKKRLADIGGQLTVKSQVNHGTEIILTIALDTLVGRNGAETDRGQHIAARRRL